jgi:hypothetical protein
MLYTLRFSLQNAVYFIMLPFLGPVLFTFYIQGVLKFEGVKRLNFVISAEKLYRGSHKIILYMRNSMIVWDLLFNIHFNIIFLSKPTFQMGSLLHV